MRHSSISTQAKKGTGKDNERKLSKLNRDITNYFVSCIRTIGLMDKEFQWQWDFETDNWGECWTTESRICTVKLGAKKYAEETTLTDSIKDTICHELAHTITHDLRVLALRALPESMSDWANQEEHRVVSILVRFIREATDKFYEENF